MAAEALNGEGNKLYMAGDKKAALEKYSQAIGVDPKVAKYHSNRAQVLLDLNKFRRAAADAEKAAELEPAVLKHLFRAAQAYYGLEEYKTAIERALQMQKLDPACANAQQILKASSEALAARTADLDKPLNPKQAGLQFLQQKDAEEGVYRLDSGLRFSILRKAANEATARSPKPTDKCIVHYHGTLIDGTVFDSSVERDDPASFAPSEVIAGWTEALQYMCEGEKWRVFLPYNLAYGAEGCGDDIPGYSTLVFTIELIRLARPTTGKMAAEGHAALSKELGVAYSDLIVVE